MEPKTIGKFIAALRRANGYTQRELADKLSVSDKAVSRWERDECAPDLMLLPVIAEIFGITTDELLRGERNSPDQSPETPSVRASAKSEKQFKNLLRRAETKYHNLTVISIGIAIVGLIAAMICNFGFLRARIGLLVGSVFYLAAIVCQICFANLSLTDPADEETDFAARLKDANLSIIKSTYDVIFVAATLFVASLPLSAVEAYMGLTAESWFLMGLIFAATFALIICLCHLFFLDSLILKKAAPLVGENRAHPELDKKTRRLFFRMMLIALIGAILPAAAGITIVSLDETLIAKGTAHGSYEEFKTYIETKISYYDSELSIAPETGFYVVEIDGQTQIGVEEPSDTHTLAKDGKILLEFEWNNATVGRIELNKESPDGLPIRTYEKFELSQVRSMQEGLSILCVVLIIIETCICLILFFTKQYKMSKQYYAVPKP